MRTIGCLTLENLGTFRNLFPGFDILSITILAHAFMTNWCVNMRAVCYFLFALHILIMTLTAHTPLKLGSFKMRTICDTFFVSERLLIALKTHTPITTWPVKMRAISDLLLLRISHFYFVFVAISTNSLFKMLAGVICL